MFKSPLLVEDSVVSALHEAAKRAVEVADLMGGKVQGAEDVGELEIAASATAASTVGAGTGS